MSNSTPTQQDLNTAQQLGEVKGQFNAITQLLNAHHQASNQRMDDLKKSIEERFNNVDTRFDSLDQRLTTVEKNERNTAIKAALSGSISGGLVYLATEAIRNVMRVKGG